MSMRNNRISEFSYGRSAVSYINLIGSKQAKTGLRETASDSSEDFIQQTRGMTVAVFQSLLEVLCKCESKYIDII